MHILLVELGSYILTPLGSETRHVHSTKVVHLTCTYLSLDHDTSAGFAVGYGVCLRLLGKQCLPF